MCSSDLLPLLIKMDAGKFKGAEELARRHGFTAGAASDVSHEIVGTIEELSNGLLERHPGAVLFGGQLAFRHETVWTRWLHNSAVYALQHLFCRRGVPFVIVPARV